MQNYVEKQFCDIWFILVWLHTLVSTNIILSLSLLINCSRNRGVLHLPLTGSQTERLEIPSH